MYVFKGYVLSDYFHPIKIKMLKKHTADKYILDGEIRSQDLVHVSSAKFKNGKFSNLLCD